MCFEMQRSVVDPDAHNVFVGHFFSAVRHRFERMFSECEPSAYATDRVNAACEQLAPPEMQGCTLNPPDRAGVYCTSGPGLSPFTLDTTLRFARQGLAEVLWEELSKAHSAGWWLSAMCMPHAGDYLRELRRIPGNHSRDCSISDSCGYESGSGSGSDGGGNSSSGSIADSADEDEDSWPSFAECYNSSWWDAPPPVHSAGFVTQPDGSALPADEAAVYAELGEGWPLNPKMLYCFCGSSSRNLESTVGILEHMKWGLLGFTLAALLALVCEVSLVCCEDDDDDDYSDDDVDSGVTRGRRPREFKGPQLLDEITISSTSATSRSTTPYNTSSTSRGMSSAELEAAEAAAKYSRSSSAAADEKKAGKREGKRRVIGGGGPTFEERQALERERAREGARMAEEREGFERRMAEERVQRDAENAARLAAFQAERRTAERAAKHAKKKTTRALRMVGIKTAPRGAPKPPKVQSRIDERTGAYIEGPKPGKAKRVLHKLQAGRNAVRARTGSRRRARMDSELEVGEV